MANVERLTKRVKSIEEWIEQNEGAPTLNHYDWLLDTLRNASDNVNHLNRQMSAFQGLQHEFLEERELVDEWNAWLKEKNDNAVQEQQTEEVSVQEEAESSEEVSEAQEEEAE